MAKYSLDTNVLIDALNQPAPLEALLEFLSWALPACFLSAVVAHELEARASTPRQRALLDQRILGPFERRGRIFAPSVDAWRRAGRLVEQGLSAPTAGSLNDVLLAVSCREAGLTLVTRDRDFRRLSRAVKGLRLVSPFPPRPATEGAYPAPCRPPSCGARSAVRRKQLALAHLPARCYFRLWQKR